MTAARELAAGDESGNARPHDRDPSRHQRTG